MKIYSEKEVIHLTVPDPRYKRGGTLQGIRSGGTSIRRKLALAAAVVPLLATGFVVGVATSASAHTGDLDVSATCNTATGEYDFTAVLHTASTSLDGETKWKVGTASFQGTPSSNAGLDRGPVASHGAQTITLGSWTEPGTMTGNGPWVYAFTTWTDGYTKGSDGQLMSSLGGDCAVPTPKDASIGVATTPATCRAAGSATFTQVNATWNAAADLSAGDHTRSATAASGHLFGNGAASDSVSYTIEPQLDANAPPCYTPPVIPKDATAVVNITTAATCTATGVATLTGDFIDKDAVTLDETPGTHTVQVTSQDGHQFADGSTTLTVTYTVPDKLSGDQCATIVTPVGPAVTQAPRCDVSGSVTPAETVGVKYVLVFDRKSGDYTVTATPASDAYKFDGDQVVTFTGNAGPTIKCPPPVEITPLAPAFNDQQCTADGPSGQNNFTVSYVEGLIASYTINDGTPIDVKSSDYVDGMFIGHVNDYYGDYTITVRRADGLPFDGKVQTTWEHKFVNTPCETTPPTSTPTPPAKSVSHPTTPKASGDVLASTGSDVTQWSLMALLMLAAGGVVLTVRKFRRRKATE